MVNLDEGQKSEAYKLLEGKLAAGSKYVKSEFDNSLGTFPDRCDQAIRVATIARTNFLALVDRTTGLNPTERSHLRSGSGLYDAFIAQMSYKKTEYDRRLEEAEDAKNGALRG